MAESRVKSNEESLQDATTDLTDEFQGLQTTMANLTDGFQGLQNAMADLNTQMAAAGQNAKSLLAKYDRMERTLQSYVHESNRKHEAIMKLLKNLLPHSEEIDELEEEVELKENEIDGVDADEGGVEDEEEKQVNPPKIEDRVGAIQNGLSTDSDVDRREAESISNRSRRSSAEKVEVGVVVVADDSNENDPSESSTTEEGEDDSEKPDGDDESEKKTKTEKVIRTTYGWKFLNNVKAIWLRNPEEVTEEEYTKFYHPLEKGVDNAPNPNDFSNVRRRRRRPQIFDPGPKCNGEALHNKYFPNKRSRFRFGSQEVDKVLEFIKKTWGVLGIDQMLHNLCFSWILYYWYIATGLHDGDLLVINLLMEVENYASTHINPIYSKALQSVLSSIWSWPAKRLLAYQDSFHTDNARHKRGREEKKFVVGVGEWIPDALEVLNAADQLERDLVQIAVVESGESEDGGKSIVQQRPPYEAEAIISKLVKLWISARVDRLKEGIDKFMQKEPWSLKANKEHFAPSAVEIHRKIDETLEACFLLPIPGHASVIHGLDNCLQQYISRAKSGCGSRATFIPTVPALNRCTIGSTLAVTKTKEKLNIAMRRKNQFGCKNEDVQLVQVAMFAFLFSIERSPGAQQLMMEKGLHLMRDVGKRTPIYHLVEENDAGVEIESGEKDDDDEGYPAISFSDAKQNTLLWASTYQAAEFLDHVALSKAKAKRKANKGKIVLQSHSRGVSDDLAIRRYDIRPLEQTSTCSELMSSRQRAIEGFKAQSVMVIDSLDRLITTREERKESIVVGGIHSHGKLESLLKCEIAKFSEMGGLLDSVGVEKLVQLMIPEGSDKKIDVASRSMIAGVITATDNVECLSQFVNLTSLPIFDEWLQEIHKGKFGDGSSTKECDKSAKEFLLILLGTLDKFPINILALQMCNIGKSVNYLRTHKNIEIQKKARSLVDIWKKRVEADMSVNDSKSGPNQSAPWTPKDGLPRISVVTSANELPQTVAREEKSSSSSQSYNNIQSCSSEHARTGGMRKEDVRSSIAGSVAMSKASRDSLRQHKSLTGFLSSAVSGAQRETISGRSSLVHKGTASERISWIKRCKELTFNYIPLRGWSPSLSRYNIRIFNLEDKVGLRGVIVM